MPTIPILTSDSAEAVEYKISIGRAYAEVDDALTTLSRNRNYYDGAHTLLLNDDQTAFLKNIIGTTEDTWPIDNKCRKVVDKVRARINVTGWRDGAGGEAEVGDEVTGEGPLAAAMAWWVANDMDRWEGEVYRAALRDGEAYLLVDHDGTRPRFTFAQAYDGTSGIRVRYSDEIRSHPLYAVKHWTDLDPQRFDAQGNPWAKDAPVLGVQRATIYTANAVWKYARLSGETRRRYKAAGPDTPDGWTPIMDAGDTYWPLPWVDKLGQPLGLAVVPFVSPRGSLIAQVIGLNNALNKTNLDMLSVADQSGFGVIAVQYEKLPSLSSTGTDVDPASDGLGIRPGRTIETTGKVTKLAADDMKGLLDYARHLTVSLASNSDIPLHELIPTMGEVPSGTALQMLDSALALQASEIETWFTASWRETMDLAQKLAVMYGGLVGEPTTLTPTWAPTSYLDEQGMEANKTAVSGRVKAYVEAGMPLEVALKREGWTDEELAELTNAKEADAAAAQTSLATALAAQQRVFDAGQGAAMPAAQGQPAAMAGNGRVQQ